MKNKTKFRNRLGMRSRQHASVAVFALALLIPLAAQGGGVVSECTEASLRAAMAGGGTVTFACDGTITLASQIMIETDTVLDGSGHQVTISGSNAVPVFVVQSGVRFTAVNLAIANGRGGVVNLGGLADLVHVEFRTNRATSPMGPWRECAGGSVLNDRGGTVNATNCTFVGNTAEAPQWNGTPATPAYGGAVLNESGQVNLHECEFIGNRAAGGGGAGGTGSPPHANPFPGAEGAGGAVANLSGTVIIDQCAFHANTAVGGQGGSGLLISLVGPPGADGGPGLGGAVFNLGTLVVTRTVFGGNALAGGAGGHGADGHGPQTGGSGGTAGGGAIYNAGLLEASACTFAGNTLRGGGGGAGGNAAPDHFGAAGGRGGDAQGGALLSSGTGSVQNCTFAWNTNFGGVGGQGGGASMYARGGGGGGGGAARGGICLTGNSLDLVNCTVAFNSNAGGPGGAGGYGGTPGTPGGSGGAEDGGISSSTGARLVNTLLATNTPGGNCYGPLTDLGHNLSSDGTGNFTNVGSLNNTDPKIGPLADNSGPTLTMALLPGSPAIDAGDTAAAPPTDQRGHPRPVGLAADIGAYEYGTTPRLRIGLPQAGTVEVLLYDASGPSCRLFKCTTLTDWQCIATNPIGPSGTALFQEDVAVGETQRFYRVAVP